MRLCGSTGGYFYRRARKMPLVDRLIDTNGHMRSCLSWSSIPGYVLLPPLVHSGLTFSKIIAVKIFTPPSKCSTPSTYIWTSAPPRHALRRRWHNRFLPSLRVSLLFVHCQGQNTGESLVFLAYASKRIPSKFPAQLLIVERGTSEY